jgi:hypothetical protein
MTQHPDYKRRVFLDIDSLTHWETGIHQRFPKPDKIALTGIEPGPRGSCDAAMTTFPQVLFEDGQYRMWYYGLREAENAKENCDRPLVCYAQSPDGIHWEKPNLKITGQNRYPGNNLLTLPGVMTGVVRALPGTSAKYLAVTIMYADPLEKDITDVPGNPDPLTTGNGTHIWASDDGLRWRHVTRVLAHGDNACLFADQATNRYLLYQKVGGLHGLSTRRMWIGLESKDGKHWEGYSGVRRWRGCFVADDYDDLVAQQRGSLHSEIYTTCVHRVGEVLVGLNSLIDTWPQLKQTFGQNPNGLGHCRIGFSQDGFNWRFPKGRPSWMDLGPPGEPDAGFIELSSTMVDTGDHHLIYYAGSTYRHGWSINPDFSLRTDINRDDELDSARIMLARIKRDRFASLASTYISSFDVDADHPMGTRLSINLLAPKGQVRVALAAKSDPWHGTLRKHSYLPGFSFDDCLPITGDHTQAPVQFKNANIADIPSDLPLTIRFELTRAEVFAYQWH